MSPLLYRAIKFLTAYSQRIRPIGFGFLLLLVWTTASALVAIPDLSHRVTDLTNTLSATQVEALETKLAAIEAKQGSQLAVLIVPSTQPEAIEQYSIRVADAWKIGRKKIDDGIILIIAKNDRKLRIEVGYGLEGAIPDVIAKRIISDTISPFFKTGDFAGGIDAGVTQIAQLIAGEILPPPKTSNGNTQQDDGTFMLILISGVFAGWFLSAIFGRTLGGTVAALGSAAITALILELGFSIIMGLMVFFIVGVRQRSAGGWSNGSGGGFSGGGFGGGGSSSWGGGGGGFGGGGASGSW